MILTLKELADHLKVNERTILRMQKSGQIQGFKIGGQWRFNSSQIDSVFFPAQDNKPTDEVPLSELTRFHFEVPISRILKENRFFFDLKATTPEELIAELTPPAVFNSLVLDIRELREKCLAREKMLSTGVGAGLAVPHPRDPIPSMKAPGVIVFGRSQKGIEFGAADGKPVHIFWLIVSQSIEMHLHLMGRIASLLRDKNFVAVCRKSNAPAEILQGIMKHERADILGEENK